MVHNSPVSQGADYYFRRLGFRLFHPLVFNRLQKERERETLDGYSYRPFDTHRCIFVHIPKCAGVSICKSLFQNLAGGHTTMETYQIIFTPEQFRQYFKFTVVRNPWDRVVSAFLFLKSGGMNEVDRRWAADNLSAYDDFNAFALGWLSRSNSRAWLHFRPQTDFICVGKKPPCVDFIAYYENLDADFAFICNKLNVRPTLQNLNANPGPKKDYRDYYTAQTRRKVADVYAEDIRVLGYSFDNASLPQQLGARQND